MRQKMMVVTVVALACLLVAPVLGADDPNDKQVNPEVKKLVERLTADIDKLAVPLPENATDEDKAKLTEEFDLLRSFVKVKLVPLCTNKVFAQEVNGQNAKQVSLEEIQKIDKQWAEAEDELPIQAEKMSNGCAKEITKIVKTLPVLGETFVMDNQGANVGQNALTTDYWQGDEAKWKNSFKDGKGGIDIGKRQLDKSTNVVDQKVSLPIIDEQGKVIGAVCFGVKVESLNQVAVASNSSN
jgi:hypothetical protein